METGDGGSRTCGGAVNAWRGPRSRMRSGVLKSECHGGVVVEGKYMRSLFKKKDSLVK